MREDLIIREKEIKKFTSEENLADKARALLKHQTANWELAKNGYESLKGVKVKKIFLDKLQPKVQFNPGRIKSSSAKVDKKSIAERPCFLCADNLPADQKALAYKNYLILVNPFPIFPEHFTIPKIDHVPQLIQDNFEDMLDLTMQLGKYYTLFYNGPKCGASAPDHFHFQAGLKSFMPLDDEYENLINSEGEIFFDSQKIKVAGVNYELGKFISFEASGKKEAVRWFNRFYDILQKVNSDKEEPMLNILSNFIEGKWRIIFFPRMKHRPAQYFQEGQQNILLSPASVDMGGVLITPLEKDFDKIDEEDVKDIFRQISISTEFYEFIKSKLTEAGGRKIDEES